MYYKDLTDQQINNISYLLEFAKKSELDNAHQLFPEIIKKNKLAQYRNSVLQAIMHNNIPIEIFQNWLNNLKLNADNSIAHYEYSSELNTKIFSKAFLEDALAQKNSILNINRDNLNEFKLYDVEEIEQQLLFKFVMPAMRINPKYNSQLPNKENFLEKSLFFSYAWFDKSDSSLTLSVPNTEGYKSIFKETKSRKFLSSVLTYILEFFKNEMYLELKFLPSHWVNNSLRTIALEYYSHNNPIIDEELESIKQNLSDFVKSENPLNQLCSLSTSIDTDVAKKRILNTLLLSIEKELIVTHDVNVNSDCKFEVFLQEVNKGATTFTSKNSFSENPSLHMFDVRDIILNILDKATIKSIGLRYKSEIGLVVPYKFSCKEYYFLLEPLTTKQIERELVRDVLCQFKSYKENVKNRLVSKHL